MATRFAEARVTAQEALQFHAMGKPGKLEITPTKPLATQRDLSLAYSPGVAIPVQAIASNPSDRLRLYQQGQSRRRRLQRHGDPRPRQSRRLAAKPVMEGKAALFKRFADIDSIDLLVDTPDVEAFINSVRYLGPSFGGINLEDIKSPDCFIIEER
jgi:malate dehydrogenase (oxaloacetate-decarboxylating)(NADP+)